MVMPIGIYSTQIGMTQAQKTFEKAAQAIATGINARVNPADMYVSSGLDSSIRSSHKAIENAQNGYNFVTQADSSLASVTDNFNRIKELSVQAANGIYSDAQRSVIQAEINQNVEQIKQTFSNSTFNGKQTLNIVTPENTTIAPTMDFMVSPDSSSVISYNPNISIDSLNFDVSTPEAAQNTMGQVDEIINEINSKRAEIGTVQTGFEGAIEQQTANIMSSSAALSSIQDTDYVSAIAELKKSQYSMELMAKVMKTVMNSERYVLDLIK